MRKTTFLLFLAFLTVSSVFSQRGRPSNLVLFSEQGEGFVVVLNGVRVNQRPFDHIKLEGLEKGTHKVRVVFANRQLGQLEKMIDIFPGREKSYGITVGRNGYYRFKFASEYNMNYVPIPPQRQMVVSFNAPVSNNAGGGYNMNITWNNNGGSISMGGGNGGGRGGNGGGRGGNGGNWSGGNGGGNSGGNNGGGVYIPPEPEPEPVPEPVYDPLPGYTGPVGCPTPMEEGSFGSAIQSIRSKSFEDSKLQIAKQILRDNCVFSSQVVRVMNVFSFESTKLDFAKFAYDYTYDIGNYFKVNDAFTFESSIEELSDFLDSRR